MNTFLQQVRSWFSFGGVSSVSDDSRYDAADRAIERRLATLDATKARDDHARLEALGVNRQILEERLESELQERKRAKGGGDHAGTG